jgi:hypothetical protein
MATASNFNANRAKSKQHPVIFMSGASVQALRGFLTRLAFFLRLSSYGSNLLNQPALHQMQDAAILLVAILTMEWLGWISFANAFLEQAIANPTLRQLAAVMIAGVFSAVVYVIERSIITMDSDTPKWRVGITMAARGAMIAFAASIVAVTIDLSLFATRIEARIRSTHTLSVIAGYLGQVHALDAAQKDEPGYNPIIQDGIRAIRETGEKRDAANKALGEVQAELDQATRAARDAKERLNVAQQEFNRSSRRVKDATAELSAATPADKSAKQAELKDAQKNSRFWWSKREQERTAVADAGYDVARLTQAKAGNEAELASSKTAAEKAKSDHQAARSALVHQIEGNLNQAVQSAREQPICQNKDGSSTGVCGFPDRAKAFWAMMRGDPIELPRELKNDIEFVRKLFPGEIAATEGISHPDPVLRFLQMGALFAAMFVPLMGITWKMSIGQDLKAYYSGECQRQSGNPEAQRVYMMKPRGRR